MLPSDSPRQSGRRKPDLVIDTSSPPPPPPPPPRSRERDRDALLPRTPTDRLPTTPSRPSRDSARSADRPLGLSSPDAAAVRDTADIETFLEGLTPVDVATDMSGKESSEETNSEQHRPTPRDSHDLSLSPRQVTRDSLVANMLLSLDQLSMGQIGTTPFDEPAIYPSYGNDDGRTLTFASRSGRAHGHAYSYSSDLDAPDDTSRISSRGRRSNSSSGFPSGLGRVNSMRETLQRSPGRALHSRGGRGSKSSSTNSVDAGYAHVLGSQRWARGFGARSSSFDGDPRPAPSPCQLDFSNSFFNDGYDAAPTPTVPGGPRKLTTVPSLPVLPPPESRTEPKSPARGSIGDRPRSTRSSKSAGAGRKAEPKFNPAPDLPPLPVFDLDSAPAPHIGYEKTKDAGLGPSPATAAPQPKEKPGFFRRMFGSSKSGAPGSSSSAQASAFSMPPKSSAPPPREPPASAAHTLQKKTSAFFRRRKQSITDSEPPPLPAVAPAPLGRLPLEKLEARPAKIEPSPITSLRRAMDPFLHGSPTSLDLDTPPDSPLASTETPHDDAYHDGAAAATDHVDDEGTRTRGFSPDYEPSPNAVIRKVDPEPAAGGSDALPVGTPSRQTSGMVVPESPPKSFLRDNSDSEDSPVRERKASYSESRERSLRLGPELGRRASSPSPVVSKSKSVPNLNRAREESARRQDSKKRDLKPLADTMYKPSLPSLRIDCAELSPRGVGPAGDSVNQSAKSIDEPEIVVGDLVGEPTEDDRQKAQKIFEGNEDFIPKDKAAAWMGEEGIVRQRVLRAYMDLYDFEGQSIVASLRQLCQQLLLRAETQQLDRILVAFSKRWCDCNPNHGFKSMDVIHTICYSIMLLNTDLHVADIEHRMTRSQFIKNTMTTIRQALQESAPEAFDRPSILPGKGGVGSESEPRVSEDFKYNSFRASFKPPPRPGSGIGPFSDHAAADSCGPLVKAPFEGTYRAWEQQVEIVLKDIYASIRDERLPIVGAEASPLHTPNSLSVMGMLKRSPSVLSKTPSEGVASTRGRMPDSAKANSSRWNSKSRSRPRGFGTGFSSSRTSFEDGGSVWSPTDSSATWSRLSLGRTHTSMSMDSFGSMYPRGDFQQSIGFANALSQAIIREDSALEAFKDDIKSEQLLEDESLELSGPPWVKEGIVTHKHHLDGIDKRAKDRNWTEVFAVIQKGQLSLFSFSPNKSARSKNRRAAGTSGSLPKGAVVGGGNWQDNATNLGTFSLRQTLASALPPPGYSRTRPYVWALSLPTGAVHLFQVGTPEICREFVSTANYWSARLSTHPLIGGISNIEYGWSDAIINSALVNVANDSTTSVPGSGNRPGTGPNSGGKGHSRPGSTANAASIAAAGINAAINAGRSSMQSGRSMRSASFDIAIRPGSGSSGVLGGTVPRHSQSHHNPTASVASTKTMPGDRVHIAEWTPPTQSMRPSTFGEREQLESLQAYVRSLEAELQAHNALREPMMLAFSPRGSANAARAMANWERKSEYLLKEIVKFRTYVDCLLHAEARKREIYRERETARRAARGEELSSSGESDGEHELSGDEEDDGGHQHQQHHDGDRGENEEGDGGKGKGSGDGDGSGDRVIAEGGLHGETKVSLRVDN